MVLKDKDSWRNSFHNFSLRDYCVVIQIQTYKVTFQDQVLASLNNSAFTIEYSSEDTQLSKYLAFKYFDLAQLYLIYIAYIHSLWFPQNPTIFGGMDLY